MNYDICEICKINGKYARYVEKYDRVLCDDCEERIKKIDKQKEGLR